MFKRRTILLLVLLAAGGCKWKRVEAVAPQEPEPPTTQPSRADELEAKVHILNARIEEIRKRSDRLTEEVGRLKFLNTQLRKQLAAVGEAPRERDLLKQQVLRQEAEIDRLKKRIAELEGAPPVGSTAPTALPTAAPPRQPERGGQ